MKKIFLCILTISLVFSSFQAIAKTSERKISLQTYTFRNQTVEESFYMLQEAGIKFAECYPQQLLSKKFPDVRLDSNMTDEHHAFLQDLMKKTGVQIKSYGCIMRSPKDRKEFEKQVVDVCSFAKRIGVEQVQTEAKYREIPMWLKYAKKYNLTIGVHHHSIDAPNNQYYRPEALLDLANRFDIQVVPDLGHWARAGLDPIKCLKMLKGKFKFCLHFKDLNKFGDVSNFKGVAYGEGVLDMKGIIAELDAQGFDGYFIIENEQIYEDPMPTVKKCVKWLKEN